MIHRLNKLEGIGKIKYKTKDKNQMDETNLNVKVKEKEKSPIIIDSKFTMQLIGEMNGAEVQDRVTNIAAIIMKDKKYQVTFSLKEIE